MFTPCELKFKWLLQSMNELCMNSLIILAKIKAAQDIGYWSTKYNMRKRWVNLKSHIGHWTKQTIQLIISVFESHNKVIWQATCILGGRSEKQIRLPRRIYGTFFTFCHCFANYKDNSMSKIRILKPIFFLRNSYFPYRYSLNLIKHPRKSHKCWFKYDLW